MDIPAKDLEKLKCSICENYLSRGPIYLQHDGAALCGRCYAPKRRAVRNIQYEITAKFLRFPCKNKDYGCRETVPFVDKDVEIPHEKVCEHRQYACPLLGPNCNWIGMRRDILQHCKEEHPDSVVGNPTTIVHDICKASTKTYLLRAFEVLFLLHTKMCLISGKLFHTVSYLGAATEATKYDFTLDIKRNDLFISKPGIVIPHQPTREDLSLGLTTKSLLDFLDGFDGTTFTVTVKQKSDQATKRADVVQCAECETEISVFRYRDSRGWLCECCAPARRACKNQGCAYVDIDEKSEKHEWWFCQQRTRCGICDVAIPRGTLFAHYSFEHQGDTYTTGTTWRATRTGRCLVSTTAGIAACEYMLFNTQFVLGVYIPVPSEQLKEFRCEVKLTNPATGDRNTYTPDTLYNELWDWNVVVKMEEFQPWSTEFDVVVDVVQCKT